MTSRERVYAALNFAGPDRLPRDLWGFRQVEPFRPADLALVRTRFPVDFARPPSVLGPSRRASGGAGEPGSYVDDWGSMWTNAQRGVAGEVTRPILSDWGALGAFEPPKEMLEHPAIEQVNAFCAASNSFCLGEVGPGPFERLQFPRGTQNLYLDLGTEIDRVRGLLARVHAFYRRHYELWAQTDVDGVAMGDDWGSQTSTLVSPELWRRVFRPLYEEYFALVHRAGKKVFFHSDGYIRPIIPDLTELGVDALNSQLFCMNIEELGRSFQGRVTFWGEIDRQRVLPFGTEAEVRAAVRHVKRALSDPRGGLIAQVCWTINDPVENILAAFEEWDAPMA